MASFPGGPFRPAMGRYSLLPSASNWASVSEDAENVTPVVEGTLYFVLFHCIVMPFSRDRFTKQPVISLFPFSCLKSQLQLAYSFSKIFI